jgi:NADH:ubiquinone oxidoreductase subunit F (NADH-binding)
VLELMAGRPNLPVTAWAPEAISGHKGHPTLLSNAETWAQIGLLVHVDEHAYSRQGTDREPGTTLMTLTGGPVPEVKEVPFGTRLRDVLPEFATGRPALVGGFHGAWAPWATLASARVSVDGMRSLGIPLGAGVVVSSPECPVTFTAKIVDYLAGQSAGRCGPCFNGLPALATALQSVVHGRGGSARVEQLAGLVVRRGACAHPDGTVRLVRSMLSAFPGEIAEHAAGSCGSLLMEPSMGVAS